MPSYKDIWYTSADGLRLYARDYSVDDDASKPVILCMHGLTRNSADFEDICELLSGAYRLIAVDQRGRGLSAYDTNPENYNPLVYVQDMFLLLERLGISKVVLMGTSMGGIMAMMMAAMQPELVSAIIINDIGPQVAAQGLDRLKGYVGKSCAINSWQDAAEQSEQINGIAFPNVSASFWERFARRTYREGSNGVPVSAYDPNIALPLNDSEKNTAAPDLWPVYAQICSKPMLLVRGELSDILEPDCVAKMQAQGSNLKLVEVPNVGHAPLLNEPEAHVEIERFLSEYA